MICDNRQLSRFEPTLTEQKASGISRVITLIQSRPLCTSFRSATILKNFYVLLTVHLSSYNLSN